MRSCKLYPKESDCVPVVRIGLNCHRKRFDSSPVRSAITATAELLVYIVALLFAQFCVSRFSEDNQIIGHFSSVSRMTAIL